MESSSALECPGVYLLSRITRSSLEEEGDDWNEMGVSTRWGDICICVCLGDVLLLLLLVVVVLVVSLLLLLFTLLGVSLIRIQSSLLGECMNVSRLHCFVGEDLGFGFVGFELIQIIENC